MNRWMCRLQSYVLSLAVAAAGLPVSAAPVKALRGEAYQVDCQGVLEALKSGEIDAYLLNQPQNDAQRLQLMKDYRLVFNQRFQEAILLTLKERKLDRDTGVKSLDKYISQLRDLAAQPEEQFMLFTRDVLKHMKALTAGTPSENTARVEFLRTKRVLEAIERSPQRPDLERTISDAIRLALVITLKQALFENAKQVTGSWPVVIAASAIGLAIMLYFFGEVPGYHDYTYSGQRYIDDEFNVFFMWNAGMTLAGLSSGAASGGAATGSWVGWKKFWQRREARGYVIPDTILAGGVSAKVKSLFDSYKDEADSGVWSVAKACETDICKLSPVEIAYLGHLDILDIQTLTEGTTGDVRPSNILRLIENAQAFGKDLAGNPDSFRAHMRFMGALNEIITLFTVDQNARKDAVKLLVKKIDETSGNIRDLKRKPYQSRVQDLTEERLQKNEILIQKLNSDLATLQAMQFDQDAFDKYVERIRPFVDELRSRLEPLPETPGQWKSAAEEAALILDKMKASLAK